MRRPSKAAGAALRPLLTGILLLLGGVMAAYGPALNGKFIWDDDAYVAANPVLTSPGGLRDIWIRPNATPQYYPLTFTSFYLEHRLWGKDPRGYHVVNVLLHVANAVLLLLLLRRAGIPGAWLAAVIFALHPVHVESVAWITERKNVLSGLFYFLSLYAYSFFDREFSDRDDRIENRRRSGYWLALFFFVGALLSKTVTASLPCAVLLLIWWKKGRVKAVDLALMAPFFLLGACAGYVTSLVEKELVGASGGYWSHSYIERILIATRAFWFYLGKLLWPHPLVFNYPRWDIDVRSFAQWMFPLACAALAAAVALLRRRSGRGVAAALLFFGITLFPALGFINVYPFRYSFVADHFQYLASIGPLVLCSAGLDTFLVRTGARKLWLMRGLLCGVLGLLLGALTWNQSHAYKDLRALWNSVLARNPSSVLANTNLAALNLSSGLYEQAPAYLQRAIAKDPSVSIAHAYLGFARVQMGDVERGLLDLSRALELDPRRLEAHAFMGMTLLYLGRHDQATGHLRSVLKAKPRIAMAQSGLGLALVHAGNEDAAMQHLRNGIGLAPRLSDGHLAMAIAMERRGRKDEAVASLARALERNDVHDLQLLRQGIATARRLDPPLARRLIEMGLRKNRRHPGLRQAQEAEIRP